MIDQKLAREIQQRTAQRFEILPEMMYRSNKARVYSRPRQVAMYLTRKHTDLGLQQIGNVFGGRDHTTVIHACDRVQEWLQEDPALAEAVAEISIDIDKLARGSELGPRAMAELAAANFLYYIAQRVALQRQVDAAAAAMSGGWNGYAADE